MNRTVLLLSWSSFRLMPALVLLAAALPCFLACSDMNGLSNRFLDRDEPVYARKVDTAAVHTGFKQVEMEIRVGGGRTGFVRIYWNAGATTDSTDMPMNGQPGIFRKVIDNLPEADYTFNLVSFDLFGNRSLPYEVSGRTLGDTYLATLQPRRVVSVGFDNGSAVIGWAAAGENMLQTTVRYEMPDGTFNERTVPAGETTTRLDGAKSEGRYSVRSYFLAGITTVEGLSVESTFPPDPAIQPAAAVRANGLRPEYGPVKNNSTL